MTGLFLLGVTSLVESSAVGALAATLTALVKGRLTREVMENTLRKSLGITCMFMWIILAALCFGAVFDGLGAVQAIEMLFVDRMNLSPWEILILMQLSFVIMGMFLDDTAMLVIVAPLYIPLVGALGFDLVWYGILYTITCQIAYITPPFGYNLFLMRAMAPPEVSLRDIYVSVVPVRAGHAAGAGAGDGLPADRPVAAADLLRRGHRMTCVNRAATPPRPGRIGALALYDPESSLLERTL